MRALRTILVSFVAFFFVAAAAQPAGLKEDRVALDRAYIPALAITNMKPTPETARGAMGRLEKQWAEFKAKQKTTKGGDRQWRADLDKIDAMIAAAAKVVASG